MPKAFTTLFKILGVIILVVLIAMVLLPLLYKKEIFDQLKIRANENITGKIDFKDLDISFFKNFPKLSLSIDRPELSSYVNSDTTQLLLAKEINLHLDIWNVLSKRDRLDIKGFDILDPIVNIKIYHDGSANYEINKPVSTSEASSAGLNFKLSSYKVTNGTLNYRDSTTSFGFDNFNHQGSLEIRNDLTDISTITSLKNLNYNSNGTSYLKNADLGSNLDIGIDTKNKIYTIKKNDFLLNALKLILTGKIEDKLTEGYKLDLQLKAPGNDFKELFSLIPGTFTHDYKNVKSSGSFNLDAGFNGIYNPAKEDYPDWDINVKAMNGSIQYQNMPVAIDRVNLELISTNRSPQLSNMMIKVNPFSFYLNNNPIDGNLWVENLKNNPHISSKIKGLLNLEDFKNFIPLEKGTEISGIVDLNIQTDFFQSQIQQSKFEEIKLEGNTKISNLIYKTSDLPLIKINKADLQFTPSFCNINTLEMNLGKSDMSASGTINNPLAIINDGAQYSGNLSVLGRLFDANEFLTAEAANPNTVEEPSLIPSLISRADLKLNFQYDKLIYDTYSIKNATAKGSLRNSVLSIETMNLNINESDISGNAVFDNLLDYLYKNEVLKGNLNLKSPIFNANKFMQADLAATSDTSSPEVFMVPKDMNLELNFSTPTLIYDQLDLKNFTANLKVVKDELQFKEITSNSMGGSMALSGIYNSSNPSKPVFDMKYDMKKLQFPKIFENIKTFRAIAPIAKFMEGQFNSSFLFSGSLGKDMTPDFSTMNIGGIFETIDAAIKNYKPLESIANKLNVKEFKNLALKNTKNWFTVENGQIKVKELNYKLQDIDLSIEGVSKIQGPMDFNLKFRIPRNKLNQNAIGQTAETGLGFLKNLGSKVGVNIEQGSHVNVLVNLTGKLLDPDIKFKLLGSDGQSIEETGKDMVNEVVDKAKDSLRKRAEQEVDKAKEKAMKEAQRIEDSLRAIAAKKVEEEKNKVLKKAEEEAKKHIDSSLVNKGKEVLKDKIGKGTDEILKDSTVDKIKDKMKDWNPFKKK